MSVISDFSERVSAQFAVIDSAVDGVVADVTALKSKIEQLQNSSGVISAEDQALLNSIESIAGRLATKVNDLDASTVTTPTPDEPTQPE